jgi:hypothetical protein
MGVVGGESFAVFDDDVAKFEIDTGAVAKEIALFAQNFFDTAADDAAAE